MFKYIAFKYSTKYISHNMQFWLNQETVNLNIEIRIARVWIKSNLRTSVSCDKQ